MPELPEVETVRAGLDDLLPGCQIVSEKHDWPKSFPNSAGDVSQFLIGAIALNVQRRGKVLIINLDTNYSLVIHLRMTGQMVFVPKPGSSVRFGGGHPDDSLVASLPSKSTRVILEMASGSTLYFNDQRKFGWVKLLPTDLVYEEPFLAKIGPEPLAVQFTNTIFVQRMRKRNGTSVKAAILDQTTLAGVGNIYADEGLWAAKINPKTRVKNLSDNQLHNLRKELIAVLELSITKGGSTDKNYVNAKGEKGSYLDFAKVFRREGQGCHRCDTQIIKSRVAGRGTHTCPQCQPDTSEISPIK